MFKVFPAGEKLRSTLGIPGSQVAGVGIVAVNRYQLKTTPHGTPCGRGQGDHKGIRGIRFHGRGHAADRNRTVIPVQVSGMAIVAVAIKRSARSAGWGVTGVGEPKQYAQAYKGNTEQTGIVGKSHFKR